MDVQKQLWKSMIPLKYFLSWFGRTDINGNWSGVNGHKGSTYQSKCIKQSQVNGASNVGKYSSLVILPSLICVQVIPIILLHAWWWKLWSVFRLLSLRYHDWHPHIRAYWEVLLYRPSISFACQHLYCGHEEVLGLPSGPLLSWLFLGFWGLHWVLG